MPAATLRVAAGFRMPTLTHQATDQKATAPPPHAKHQPPSNRLKGDSPPPPHTKNTNHHATDQTGDSPPPPQFARHGAHTRNHRAPQRTGGIPRAPEPQMRRGAGGGHVGSAPRFPPSALRVSHGRSSAAKQGGAERPGDGCPCVGAEETCGAHHQK